MLGEQESIDKINRYVSDPPGAWRMTDTREIEEYFDKDAITSKRPSDREQAILDKIAVAEIHRTKPSVFCHTGLCAKQTEQMFMNKVIHPRRNIDYGVECKPKNVSVGVSEKKEFFVSDSIKLSILSAITLMTVYALR